MGEIRELDQGLINKIAAGEVIERPFSVVKELIENSLDAGSTKISVSIEEGGIKSITIQDNGKGIGKEDMEIAVQRHTTSKIESVDDLYNIKTMGFRGEALSSIASISMLKITSKKKDEPVGNEIYLVNGEVERKNPIMCQDGTRIEVKELFNNVPVRKKYLRSPDSEFRKIQNVVIAYSLANPDVSFRLERDGKEDITTQKSADEINSIASLLGHDIAKNLIRVDFENKGIIIKGVISKPTYARKSKSHQYLFVNGRYINSYVITKALYQAHDTLLFGDRHPVAVLNILISPNLIDVNIHPAKAEIKFEDDKEVFRTVYNGVKKTLFESDILHNLNNADGKKDKTDNQFDFSSVKFEKPLKQMVLNDDEQKEEILFSSRDAGRNFRILGRIHHTYIIAETDDGMLPVDQHAAHEKVLYEKFKKQLEDKNIKKQDLLQPIIIEVTRQQESIISENIDLLSGLGFELSQFGPRTYRLTTLPSVLGRTQAKEILYDIVDELEDGDAKSLDKIKQDKIIMKSCKSAIKAHDNLEIDEVITLLNDLQKLEQPFTCPHGRPTMVHYSLYELEKLFLRKV